MKGLRDLEEKKEHWLESGVAGNEAQRAQFSAAQKCNNRSEKYFDRTAEERNQ